MRAKPLWDRFFHEISWVCDAVCCEITQSPIIKLTRWWRRLTTLCQRLVKYGHFLVSARSVHTWQIQTLWWPITKCCGFKSSTLLGYKVTIISTEAKFLRNHDSLYWSKRTNITNKHILCTFAWHNLNFWNKLLLAVEYTFPSQCSTVLRNTVVRTMMTVDPPTASSSLTPDAIDLKFGTADYHGGMNPCAKNCNSCSLF